MTSIPPDLNEKYAGEGLEDQTPLDISSLDHVRPNDYAYLDQQGHVYLDYTGASLPSSTQIQAHAARLGQTTSGNPHSINPTSETSNQLVASTRARVLQFLNADPNEYAVIFTANATAAAKLVGESYPFRTRSNLVLTADNHNSLNGLRIFAEKAKARTTYVPLQKSDLRIETADVKSALKSQEFSCFRRPTKNNLFAFPAQSNFSGVVHPLSWISLAQDRGYDVLLDAAAYLPTNDLNLRRVKPEFVIMSWYKVFGFPTGVGSLVVRRDALSRLNRPWFSGGTVDAVSVIVPWHGLTSDETAFEDGTANFLSIPDVEVGIHWVQQHGRAQTAARVLRLTQSFLSGLQTLRHCNDQPMAVIYGPTNMQGRGGTVAFNVLDSNGNVIDADSELARDSAAAGLSIRTGCFCNPGVGEVALDLSRKDVYDYIKKRSEPSESSTHVSLRSAVRVSFGIASIQRDVDVILHFLRKTYQS